MPLNLSDLKAWAPEIADLTESARQAAANHTGSAEFYRSLITVSAWEGKGAQAAKAAMEATARDHEAVAENVDKAAASMGRVGQEAEALAEKVKGILDDAAAQPAVQILEATNAVVPPNTRYMTEEYAAQVAAKVTDLQQRIAAVIADGERLDADLAAAIAAAAGSPQPVAKTAPSLSDMLMPDSGGNRRPGAPAPNDLAGALDQLTGAPGHSATPTNGQPAGSPAGLVPLDPSKVEQFKAVARQALEGQGVPHDQIEQRLDAAVAAAQRPSPRYTPPTPEPMPPPGFAEGFGDRWFSTEEGVRDLVGANGWDSFKESWEGLAKGTGERFANPVGATIGDVQDALNSPSAAYYLGERAADVATTAPGLMFGGETALLRAGALDDLASAGAVPRDLIDHPGPVFESPTHHGLTPSELSLPIADVPSHHGLPAPVLDSPGPLPHDSPLFDGYDPTPLGPEFTNPAGGLIYPDDSLASKPYAIPGTVIDNAEIPQGTVIDRFGHPGGTYLSPDGVPFAERALPPDSAGKPYYQYVVDDPTKLPPGWRIEQSQATPWFNQPGGGVQYRIIAPPDVDASVSALTEAGYLKETH